MDRPTTSPFDRTDKLLLVGVLLTNLVIKLSWLGVNELAHDEPFTVFWSQRPWPELWAMFSTENNPPVYFVLIKLWSLLAPFEAGWLRVPSAVFSALTAWPLYLLAHRCGGRATALLATALFTFSTYHFGFAHEVRAYSLFTLLSTTGFWLLVRTWSRAGDAGAALRLMLHLSMLNVVLVYTHYFGWLVIGLQGVLVFALPELRPLRRGYRWGTALTAAWFLPLASIFLRRMSQSVGEGTWLTTPSPEELYNMIWRWSNAPVIAVATLVVIAAALWKDRLHGTWIRFALLWTFVPLLGMFAVSYVAPIFLDRYLVYAAPGFALLVALSVETLFRNRRARLVAGLALALGMAATFRPWMDTGLHPSRVVQVEKDRCAGSCSVEVLPRWYWITHLAATDIRSLQRPTAQHMAYRHDIALRNDAMVPAVPPDTVAVALVIDAGAQLVDPQRTWYKRLRSIYPRVDSVEADRKVWVYRFQR